MCLLHSSAHFLANKRTCKLGKTQLSFLALTLLDLLLSQFVVYIYYIYKLYTLCLSQHYE